MLLAAGNSDARVFLRWGAAARSSRLIEELGGRPAYESAITLNGGEGRLAVFGFARPFDEVCRRLRRAFDAEDLVAPAGRRTAHAVAAWHGREVRLLVLGLAGARQTVVIKLVQSRDEAEASRRPPRGDLPPELPAYPGSRPRFVARDHNTGAALAVFEGAAAPEAAQAFYRRHLTSQGWVAPLDRSGSLAVYARRDRLCLVLALPAEDAGGSRIAVLHKPLGTPPG